MTHSGLIIWSECFRLTVWFVNRLFSIVIKSHLNSESIGSTRWLLCVIKNLLTCIVINIYQNRILLWNGIAKTKITAQTQNHKYLTNFKESYFLNKARRSHHSITTYKRWHWTYKKFLFKEAYIILQTTR